MVKFTDLSSAISEFVKDGETIAMEGFTHLIPFAAGQDVETYMQKIADTTALKRIATVDEVVSAIDFLANEQSSGITGQLIAVDCGL